MNIQREILNQRTQNVVHPCIVTYQLLGFIVKAYLNKLKLEAY